MQEKAVRALRRLRILAGLARRPLAGRALSGDLIESVVSRSLAGYCLLFGLTIIPAAFGGQPMMNPVWAWIAGPALFGSTFALAVAGLSGRHARVIAGVYCGVFAAVLISWPFAMLDGVHAASAAPWPWPLADVAIAAAAFAFRRPFAMVYAAVIPGIYVGVRLLPSGGGVSVEQAVSDAGFALILGAAVLLLIGMLRKAAFEVDLAHAVAADRYRVATGRHQTELERLQVDSILHDSVLTTLLIAARADTEADRQFAVTMSKHALSEVAATKAMPGVQLLVEVDELRARFEAAAADLGVDVDVATTGVARHSLPLAVVETIFAATLQAVANSVQHAGPGDVRRTVRADFGERGVSVYIRDEGVGFDTATMTPGRLGVRVSIIERVHAIGGHAHIDSTPGQGATVHVAWPAEEFEVAATREFRASAGFEPQGRRIRPSS